MNLRRPVLATACGVLVTGVLGVLGALAVADRAEPPPPASAPVVSWPPDAGPVADPRPLRGIRVLGAWDARRSAAWASGDPAALVPLYVPGSRAGRADRWMLRAYAERGLRVTGLRMQLLAVDVVSEERHALVLRVTDRLARAVARGRGVAVALPRDLPSTRIVVLRRTAGHWQVVEVTGQPRAVPSTASTSRSANR